VDREKQSRPKGKVKKIGESVGGRKKIRGTKGCPGEGMGVGFEPLLKKRRGVGNPEQRERTSWKKVGTEDLK